MLIDQLSEYIDEKDGFSELSFPEQVKYMAFFFSRIRGVSRFAPRDILEMFDLAQLPPPSNMSMVFSSLLTQKIIVRQTSGYVLHRDTAKKLEEEFPRESPTKKVPAASLRSLVGNLANKNRESFLNEAVLCYECKAYRASIIMTWILTLDHMYDYILANKLSDFNKELASRASKVVRIRNKDDFSDIKESDFIAICRSARIITNDERKLLDEKLGMRNSCAHPNTIVVPESKATSYIEDLVQNIVLKYSV